MNRYFCLIVCLVSLLCIMPHASATTILPSSLEYMTEFCDTIVTGTVSDKYSYWENQIIYTSVVISVERFEKNTHNEVASTIEIKTPGGQVGDTRFEVDQAPIFNIDDKVLLFLKKHNGNYITYGLNYGVCKITWDEAQQKEFIDGPLFQREIHYDPQTMIQRENTTLLGRTELSVFLNQMRNHID